MLRSLYDPPIGRPTTRQHRIALRLMPLIGAIAMLCHYLMWLSQRNDMQSSYIILQTVVAVAYAGQIACALRAYASQPVGGRSNAQPLIILVGLSMLASLLLWSALNTPAEAGGLKSSDFLGLFCMLAAVGVIWCYEEAKRTIDLHRSWK